MPYSDYYGFDLSTDNATAAATYDRAARAPSPTRKVVITIQPSEPDATPSSGSQKAPGALMPSPTLW